MRSHLRAGRPSGPNRASMVAARASSVARSGSGSAAGGDHHRVAFARGPQAPQVLRPEGVRDLLSAALEAGPAPEQVDAEDAVVGQQGAAVGVEGRIVEHRGGRVVVVQVDLQQGGALRVGLLEPGAGLGLHHPQPAVALRQVEPAATDVDHHRVELDHGGGHAQRLVREAGQRRRAHAELHRAPLAVVRRVQPKQAGQHALHVLQDDLLRLAHPHRALHPDRAQVQVAHAVGLRQRDRREAAGLRRHPARPAGRPGARRPACARTTSWRWPGWSTAAARPATSSARGRAHRARRLAAVVRHRLQGRRAPAQRWPGRSARAPRSRCPGCRRAGRRRRHPTGRARARRTSARRWRYGRATRSTPHSAPRIGQKWLRGWA